jgi:hypothetical protein
MTSLSMIVRGGALMAALAMALLVQGCAAPQTDAWGGGVYSGSDYAAALDSTMTTDQGGE